MPATSTILAYDALLPGIGVTRLGLVTPDIEDIERRMVDYYAAQGIEVVSKARLDDKGNYSFATCPPEQVAAMIEEVAAAKPDAIAIVCTNFRGTPVAEELEQVFGIPVLGSIAVTAAHCLKEVGLNPSRVTSWGSVFQRVASLDVTSQS